MIMDDIKKFVEFSKGLCVLYLEDNDQARHSTLDLLKNFFDHIDTAVHGKEGLKKTRQKRYDLILTDIHMPRLDGIEFTKEFRKENPHTPVIIISAHNETEYFLKTLQLGIDGYILKPMNLDGFVNTIKKSIEKLYLLHENKRHQHNLSKLIEEKTSQLNLKSQELELRYYHDSLTKLTNRIALKKHISLLERGELLLLDINRFSAINSIYGTQTGDEALRAFAKLLQSIALEKGYRTYRVSGDRFALLSNGRDERGIMETASNLFYTLTHKPLRINTAPREIELNLSVTIGIALQSCGTNLLEQAEMALKQAKKQHKPLLCYTPELEMENSYKNVFNALSLVKEALKNDGVRAYYQPIVKPGETTYECLMRIEKGGELYTPYNFLPQVKHTPYYIELTKRMIDKTFEFFRHSEHSFSINLSFEDMMTPEITRLIKERLAQTGTSEQLIIEILESESIRNFGKIRSFIEEMKTLGVRIAIDDFGSGYSNFSYLLELNPDFLKIDGSLIKDIDSNEKARAIVKSIASFAKELRIKTIAEFTHSQRVYEQLQPLGIYGYQGYLFGKPSPTPQQPLIRHE